MKLLLHVFGLFAVIFLIACGFNPRPCPPGPDPGPTPTPIPTPTPRPPIQGQDCIPGTVNCNCVDHPPPTGEGTCLICDSTAPGGVRNIGSVPICPPTGPTPGPSPTPNPAYLLPAFPPQASPVATRPPAALNEAVTTAILTVAKTFGPCNVGGDCSLGPDPQAAQQAIIVQLTLGHVFAGQDEPGTSDEIVACLTGECRYAYHAVKYPSGGGPAKAVWPQMPSQDCFGGQNPEGIPTGLGCPGVGGGAFRGLWTCPGGCPHPGAAASCPAVPADVEYWKYELKPHDGQQLDLTPLACGGDVVSKIVGAGGQCRSSCCEMATEKGDVNAACQASLYGIPLWVPVSGLNYFTTLGPFTVKIAGGSGIISSASTKGPAQASGPAPNAVWSVTATVPACTVGTDGLCH